MPELPTQKVIAALKRSNSNIEAATIELLDDAILDEEDQPVASPRNPVLDLSGDHDLSDTVIEEVSPTNKVLTLSLLIRRLISFVVGQPSQRTGPTSSRGKH